jgi:hypothetical protein
MAKDIGDNRFVVRFTREGDWNHVKKNGPWQFDFNAILIKDFDGSVRPSDMVFDTLDIYARVADLPMDMMNRVFGELIGGWIGKFISVDVDEEGIAWGEDLRIRVAIKVDQPLVRGVSIKESAKDEVGKWFDIRYEKIPHFCFDCGCLVHAEGKCRADGEEPKQWGEWLRVEPRKTKNPPSFNKPTMSSGSYSSRTFSADSRNREPGVFIRDIPPRRNMSRDVSYSSSSRTGVDERYRERREVTSPMRGLGGRAYDGDIGEGSCRPTQRSSPPRRDKQVQGTFARRARKVDATAPSSFVPLGMGGRKRGSKQVWLPVEVRVVEEGAAQSAGKRQRTNSVFDRLEDPTNPSADLAGQGRRGQ